MIQTTEDVQTPTTVSKIDMFYKQCTNNCAIMTTADLKAKLETIEGFDWEEFNKPLS